MGGGTSWAGRFLLTVLAIAKQAKQGKGARERLVPRKASLRRGTEYPASQTPKIKAGSLENPPQSRQGNERFENKLPLLRGIKSTELSGKLA